MQNIIFMKPNWAGTGLSNQLFFVITSIIRAHKQNKKIVVLDNFLLEPMTHNMCPISEIINFKHLNIITKKYNVTVLDKNFIKFSIVSIKYGLGDNIIDVTDYIIEKYYNDKKLLIPMHTQLNLIKGDPILGMVKKLYITYNINGIMYTDEYNEYLFSDICIDLINSDSFRSWDEVNINAIDSVIFNDLLKQIKFCDNYYDIANKYIMDKNMYTAKPMHVIHLRIEYDMTSRCINSGMTHEQYVSILEEKYINLIKKYIPNDEEIMLLSYSTDNSITKFLNKNGYKYHMHEKDFTIGREINAIIDLLIGERCTGNFIGNWVTELLSGSTYSYVLMIRMNECVKKIIIDLSNIDREEYIL